MNLPWQLFGLGWQCQVVPIKTQVFCIHAVVWSKVMIREQQMIPYLNCVAV